MQNKIAVIGECMLELSGISHDGTSPDKKPTHGFVNKEPQQTLAGSLSFGGDTLNTAVYLARLGVGVDYVTALGDDSMSAWMLSQWRAEGVGCELVARFPHSVPGLYLIQVDENGERSFLYWRAQSPATKLFDDANAASNLFEKLFAYQHIYLSGISLALYAEPARQRLFDFLAQYRMHGGHVIFDDNYRPKLWSSPEVARDAYERMYRLTDLALPTDEDEQLLYGEAEPEKIIKNLQSLGVTEIVLKIGSNGCLISQGAISEGILEGKSEGISEGMSEGILEVMPELIPAEEVPVIDTTAAGDSFNAGFIAAMMQGKSSTEAAKSGHTLAASVIQHQGAIIPVSAMPSLLEPSI